MAHRRDVDALVRRLAMTVAVLASLVWPVAAAPDQPCEVVPMPCTFEGLPFKITVIDAETRKPLADVHALAEWQIHGAGGRLNGPLMVLDAASGPDGALAFPGWGPVDGSVMGLGIGRDPIITLFKSGYKALVINNADHERLVSRFEQRDDRIAANPQAHDRTVDGPPARKSKRTVRAAGCVQHHERTVEPTARAMDLPLGQRMHIGERLSRLGIDD